MKTFLIEITDTYGGEANYSWVKRWLVKANTERGAISKLARLEGGGFRLDWNSGDTARYNLKGACVCAFVSYLEDSAISAFNGTETI